MGQKMMGNDFKQEAAEKKSFDRKILEEK